MNQSCSILSKNYGEDRFAKNIAKHIVRARQEKEIETTGELIEIIKAAIPAKVRATGGHPAKRTFQAIRIELNKELEVLENSIDKMTRFSGSRGQTSISPSIRWKTGLSRTASESMKIHVPARPTSPCACAEKRVKAVW